MVKKNAEKDVGFVRQFNELKKKHPDAVLLFRKGDFYEMYKEDALKASVILALKVSDKILPLEKDPIKLLTFPRHELTGQASAQADSLRSAGRHLRGDRPAGTDEEAQGKDRGRFERNEYLQQEYYGEKEERTGCAGRANQNSQDGCRGETCQGKEDGSQSRSQE